MWKGWRTLEAVVNFAKKLKSQNPRKLEEDWKLDKLLNFESWACSKSKLKKPLSLFFYLMSYPLKDKTKVISDISPFFKIGFFSYSFRYIFFNAVSFSLSLFSFFVSLLSILYLFIFCVFLCSILSISLVTISVSLSILYFAFFSFFLCSIFISRSICPSIFLCLFSFSVSLR